jgi:3-isopropylmalate/(R)-2-methylmalate dehydratase small subunit
MQIQWDQTSAPIQMGEGSRNMFLSGTWDACGQLVSQATAIQTTASQLPYLRWSTTV